MKMKGLPLNLNAYEASETVTNKHFREFKMSEFERIYLPDSMGPFTDLIPRGTKEFVVDDNRGAVSTIHYRGIVAKRLAIWRAGPSARYYFDESVRNGRPYFHSRIPSRASSENTLPS